MKKSSGEGHFLCLFFSLFLSPYVSPASPSLNEGKGKSHHHYCSLSKANSMEQDRGLAIEVRGRNTACASHSAHASCVDRALLAELPG